LPFIEIHDESSNCEDKRVLLNVDWIKAIHPTEDGEGCNVIVGDGYAISSSVPVECYLAKESFDILKAMIKDQGILQPKPAGGKF
jgi:hypothetical protein